MQSIYLITGYVTKFRIYNINKDKIYYKKLLNVKICMIEYRNIINIKFCHAIFSPIKFDTQGPPCLSPLQRNCIIEISYNHPFLNNRSSQPILEECFHIREFLLAVNSAFIFHLSFINLPSGPIGFVLINHPYQLDFLLSAMIDATLSPKGL